MLKKKPEIRNIPSYKQTTDCMIKLLTREHFESLRSKLGVVEERPLLLPGLKGDVKRCEDCGVLITVLMCSCPSRYVCC